MKVYIDSSSLNRIFDDQSQAKIYLQASSMLLIFKLIEDDAIDLVSSEVLVFENNKNPYEDRRIFVNHVLRKAKYFQDANPGILKSAQVIEASGIKGVDALHLACAEASEIDYFITCDDKMIRRYNGKLVVTDPTEFVLKMLKENKNVSQ